MVKYLPANVGDMGWIPGSGRSPGDGNGKLLQYSCPGNPMDRGSQGYSPHGGKDSHVSERFSTHSCKVINEMLCSNSGRREKEGKKV